MGNLQYERVQATNDAEQEFLSELDDAPAVKGPRGAAPRERDQPVAAPARVDSDVTPVPPPGRVEVRPLAPLSGSAAVPAEAQKPARPAQEAGAPLDLLPPQFRAKSPEKESARPVAPPAQPADKLKQADATQPIPLPDLTLVDDLPRGVADPKSPSVVIVDKQHHLTHILQVHNGEVEDVLTVPNAVGADGASPSERMVVDFKDWDHPWTPPKSIDPGQKVVPPWSQSHANPLGEGFIGLKRSWGLPTTQAYGLHGTNNDDSIGFSVTHGCVRHHNADLEDIWPLVRKGTAVYFVDDINGARILSLDFSNPP